MSFPEEIPILLSRFFSIYAVQQVAPLVVIVILPLLVLASQSHFVRLFRQIYMVLESLALALPWNWRSGSSTSGSTAERNKLKKRTVVRTRADQVAANGDASGTSIFPSICGIHPYEYFSFGRTEQCVVLPRLLPWLSQPLRLVLLHELHLASHGVPVVPPATH